MLAHDAACCAVQPPTWRIKIEKCNRADVPPVPREEVPKGQEKSKVVVKSTDPHAEEMVVELDDWLIDFANLFRDQLGIDPDKCASPLPRPLCPAELLRAQSAVKWHGILVLTGDVFKQIWTGVGNGVAIHRCRGPHAPSRVTSRIIAVVHG